MTGRLKARTTKAAVCLLAAFVVFTAPAMAVEPTSPSSVDVYWKSTRTIVVPGIKSVVILDETIANAQIGNDTIEFAGLERGDTVALAYVNGDPVSIIVHVIERPGIFIPPSLRRRESELAHGTFGSDFQLSNGNGQSNYALVDSASWMQQVGDTFFSASSLFEDNTQFGGHTVNLRTGNVTYRTPGFRLSVLDFSQSLTGELGDDRVNNFSSGTSAGIRGVGVTMDRGRNEYSLFAGSTIPYYFLSLNATRDVAGFSIHRKQTDKLSFFGGTSYLNIPLNLTTTTQRRDYVMQTAGASYRISHNFIVGAQGGISNDGRLLRADSSYSSFRFSAYGTAIYSSQTFPLNQIQSLFSGTSTLKSGLDYKLTSKLTQGLYYEHTDIRPGLIYKYAGSSDFLRPNVGYAITPNEMLNVSYTYSRSRGGFNANSSTGNRYDASLTSHFGQRITNSAQVSVGSVQDPLQVSSQDEFTVRDSISLPVKGQILLLGVEHDRVNPSLIAKLNQELSVLSPVLQAEFLANPQAFVDSTNFPPEVKALLAAEQPTGTTVSASGILNIGSKLRFEPNLSVSHIGNGVQGNSWTQAFGYSLVYQFRPTLQFHSSLNNVFLFNSQQNSVVRTTVLGFGFTKSFAATPGGLPFLHRTRVIEGRVFRDTNINGAYNVGEPGIEGVEVRLDEAQVAVTDSQGRYKFPSVSADEHQLSIALTQFHNPIRMTTRSEAEVDLIQQRIAVANFGILDFARLMGNIYNDLRFDNQRQPDSGGIRDIQLLLDDGKEVRKLQSGGSGDFELDNVPPGDYKLSIDAASIPPNYIVPIDSIAVHVRPVSTVVQDIPIRALRSIAGNVLLKVPVEKPGNQAIKPGEGRANKTDLPADQDFKLVPVSGVQITAGPTTGVTDNDGKFLLRNLPAGDLKVSIRPVRAVPDGISIPTGNVKLPAEPVQIQGATIVISNPELLPYLTDDVLKAPTARTQQIVASAYARAREREKQQPRVAVASTPALQPKPTLPAKTEPALQPNEPTSTHVAAVVPASVHPVSKQPNAPAAPVAPVVVHSEQKAISYDSINRAICESMPSLGEAAQCFNQLKRATATNPQK